MSWIDRIKAAAIPFKVRNEVGLPATKVALLFAELAARVNDSALATRLVRYAVDGDDELVLNELASHAAPDPTQGLVRVLAQLGNHAQEHFFADLELSDAGLGVRLGKIAAAAQHMHLNIATSSMLTSEAPWLAALLAEISLAWRSTPEARAKPFPIDVPFIEEMLAVAGCPTDLVARAVCSPEIYSMTLRRIPGARDALLRHPSAVHAALTGKDRKTRSHVLEVLRLLEVPTKAFVAPLVAIAVGSKGAAHVAAAALLGSELDQALPLIENAATQGKTAERHQAVRLLWELAPARSRALLEQRRAEDPAPEVRELLTLLLAAPSASAASDDVFSWNLPPLASLAPPKPLAAETRAAFATILAAAEADVGGLMMSARWAQQRRERHEQAVRAWREGRAFAAFAATETSPSEANTLAGLAIRAHGPAASRAVQAFLARPELELVHAVRALILTEHVHPSHSKQSPWSDGSMDFDGYAAPLLGHYRQSHGSRFGLRELGQVLAALGLSEKALVRLVLDPWSPRFLEWEDDAVWPFFAERFEIVEEAIAGTTKGAAWWDRRVRPAAFALLAKFPSYPPRMRARLWAMALGPAKRDRQMAWKCVGNEPDRLARLVETLGSRKPEGRAVAAEWLGQCSERDVAAPAIRTALARETSDPTKGAMLVALERLGESVAEYVDRKRLVAEAPAGLARGAVETLAWLSIDALPAVHWHDDGTRVPSEVMLWLVAQARRSGNAEPGPLLRRYVAQMRRDERERFGSALLAAWIAKDTRPTYASREEALPIAHADAQQIARWRTNVPLEKIVEELLAGLLRKVDGSAIDDKGVLAVVGACGGPDSVRAIERYVREWYGYRVAQCKALLRALAWIESPLAVQTLWSIAARFRTRSIQQEAATLLDDIAERAGWTRDELADHTIPTAGLDEHGVLALDYGTRTIRAHLDAKLALVLQSDDGRALKSLPAARASDDPDEVKAAKKAFSNARKELQAAVAMQRTRLYEAMCTQRSWKAEEWDECLHRHPIVGRLVQRVVWAASVDRDDERIVTFRPLEDGSLSTVDDDPATLPKGATVRIAHTCTVGSEIAAGWRRHLADYRVDPLFEQLREASFVLSPERTTSASIDDFEGHVLDTFRLRARATALGYVRGSVEDGGMFHDYRKPFPGVGLEAVVGFTGNTVPESNRPAALSRLTFERLEERDPAAGGYWMSERGVPLGEVPTVLLAECWNDVRTLAAEGTGYDPDWRKRTEW